ncbi:aspartate/glutamate racemase family protein [Desemzia sp. RIT804]|uniref:aspartate/glutamate racemase family protein n=1 Tax=Desemzia sp. RIT 804 TaxID=2810209 RepID=UPI00194DE2E9|nr:amino acid racemase [Desemzia sp. RIT 804]MBM6613484.1 aspartate/glutamate racemase family protein [Desemzia sp. RIT 804]
MSEHLFAVLGGMGTLATENFIQELNRLSAASKDQDYLNYVVYNKASIPDRTDYILDKNAPNPIPFLASGLQKLVAMEPDFIVMPCNTAHFFYDELAKSINVPFLNMIDETVKELISRGAEQGMKIGIAATEGTIKSKIYEDKLNEAGFDSYVPNKELQQIVNDLIYVDIKQNSDVNMPRYNKMVSYFEAEQCDYVVLGCTELSIFNSYDQKKRDNVVDADDVLVRKTVELARQTQPLV